MRKSKADKPNRRIVKKNDSKKGKKKKAKYKVRNWSEYNKALVDRYDFTLWVEQGIADVWREGNKIIIKRKRKQGAQRLYSDAAIECLATLQELFHLTYRGIQGFGRALFNRMLKLKIQIPDFSTINRRRKHLRVTMFSRSRTSGKVPINLVLDSSGLKVYGEGEWKVRQHGISKRRTWRKIHLGINPQTGDIEGIELTDNGADDGSMVKPVLDQVKKEIASVGADGAYDKRKVYEELMRRGVKGILIPPCKGAHIWFHGNRDGDPHPRDENVRGIRKLGRKQWKEESGYHMRSHAEVGVYRYKTIFSDQLSGRDMDHQTVEVKLKCKILNKMNTFGTPDSYKVNFTST